ncbi:MAG TPA: hypothetical protein VFK05_32895 [Polyangiaceae bacterium]|nr:hypothetical protein [Polyangiaceae bacterium]
MAGAGYANRSLWWTLGAALLLACGGSATTSFEPGAAAGAGSGAPRGSGSAGASGAPGGAGTAAGGGAIVDGRRDCLYEGKSYADGDGFPASDGCNTCSCHAGVVSCTLLGCATGCQYQGQHYEPGQSFGVDCNTCTCGSDGRVSCTGGACPSQCALLQDQYAAALKRAKACDPHLGDQCTESAAEVLECGCATAVNASNTMALAELSQLSMQAAAVCPSASCTGCAMPGPAYCSAEGVCVNAQLAACKVDGVVYPSGSSGIPKPGDCNSCRCEDGALIECTEKACPPDSACPAGTVATTQCAACGPTDGCEIVEHACLPTCTDSCASGSCTNGACRWLCF